MLMLILTLYHRDAVSNFAGRRCFANTNVKVNLKGRNMGSDESSSALSDDLLKGADEIAEFLLGDGSKRRQIYHLAQRSSIPVFKLASTLCARKSRLLIWIEEQELHAMGHHRD